MPQFLVGDELGAIKVLRCLPNGTFAGENPELKSVYKHKVDGSRSPAVQALSATVTSDGRTISSAAFADGSAHVASLQGEGPLHIISEWKETRMSSDNVYVGLAVSEKAVYSCTSNGSLRMTSFSDTNEGAPSTDSQCSSLPTRLCAMRMSPTFETIAYGGDEVDLSVWDTEQAFQSRIQSVPAGSKKRKRIDTLLPGEVWRAKNVSNDSLGLRQPIRISSLCYIGSHGSSQHLLTGSKLGEVRRYDTRAARRPVADWKGICKVGGVRTAEKGISEHEAFISDYGSNLFSIDLRNGRISYSYKGLAGAVNSIAASSLNLMASTALDRFTRIHSLFPPPTVEGQRQDKKGEVIAKIYMKSTPTAIVWDQNEETELVEPAGRHEDEDLWDKMDNADDPQQYSSDEDSL